MRKRTRAAGGCWSDGLEDADVTYTERHGRRARAASRGPYEDPQPRMKSSAALVASMAAGSASQEFLGRATQGSCTTQGLVGTAGNRTTVKTGREQWQRRKRGRRRRRSKGAGAGAGARERMAAEKRTDGVSRQRLRRSRRRWERWANSVARKRGGWGDELARQRTAPVQRRCREYLNGEASA